MFQTILTIVSLIGNYLNCRKLRVCFIIWIMCNLGWVYVDLHNGAYSRMILNIAQIIFNIYGLKQWSKGKGEKNNEDEQ